MQTPEQVALSFTGECEPASLGGNCAVHGSPLGGARTCLHVFHLSELIRARDAEVREAARAEALAGFVEERRTREDGYAGAAWDTTGRTQTTTTFMRPGTRERRLVGPWEPVANATEGETDD